MYLGYNNSSWNKEIVVQSTDSEFEPADHGCHGERERKTERDRERLAEGDRDRSRGRRPRDSYVYKSVNDVIVKRSFTFTMGKLNKMSSGTSRRVEGPERETGVLEELLEFRVRFECIYCRLQIACLFLSVRPFSTLIIVIRANGVVVLV